MPRVRKAICAGRSRVEPLTGEGQRTGNATREVPMFRKLMLASVSCAGLLSALAIPSNASANEFHREHRPIHHEYRHEHVFRVYYRDPCRPGWIIGGMFYDRPDAVRLAAHYRHLGFAVRIG